MILRNFININDTYANTPLRLTSLLIDVDIKLVSILSAVTMLVLTFALL